VWGVTGEAGREEWVEWSWVELLEFLSNAWPYLAYESGYPLGLRPSRPAELRNEAEARWEGVPEDVSRGEEEELFAFEETHDLARGVHGLFAPSVLLVREGALMTIGSRGTTIRRPLKETLNTLEQFGEAVRVRIDELDDGRSKAAVQNWNKRLSMSPWSLAQIATRWPEDELRAAAGETQLALDLEGDEFRVTESLEIAGLARGFLGPEGLKTIIALLGTVGPLVTPKLDALSDGAAGVVENINGRRPYNQGYELAHWLRPRLDDIDHEGRVGIDTFIEGLGVRVEKVDLANNLLDAVACWGPRHGPAIWINLNEKHSAVGGALRSTLAHELCHLLIDRKGALPLADVINGNAPKWVEQRADAFAAELLLPRRLAAAGLSPATDIDAHVARLATQYGVSRELAAWQIRNSESILSPAQRAKLRTMVSNPANF